MAALEREGGEAAQNTPPAAVDAKVRRFEPVQLVAARLELAGPQHWLPAVRAGIDIRGDGSSEAFVGRVRRHVVEQREGESSYDALRRALTAEPASPHCGAAT